MSSSVYDLRSSETFINMLTTFSNPILGIALGIVFTSVIQSASAAVGILQALAITGAIRFDIALPIIMGIAIGAGFYEWMLVGSLLIVVCMRGLPVLEDYVISKSRNMNISLEMDSLENLGSIIGKIKADGLKLYDVEIEKNVQKHITMFSVFVSVGLPKKVQHTEVLAMLSVLDGVVAIEEA